MLVAYSRIAANLPVRRMYAKGARVADTERLIPARPLLFAGASTHEAL